MATSEVDYELRGPVALVTLDRPRYRNAQSWKLLDELDAALDRAVADPEVRVVVVRGAGGHFSSGHDLGTPEQRADLEARGLTEQRGQRFYESFRRYNLDYTLKWRNLPKPTIAMVEGYCIFGGWMIAAAMDLVFAAEQALFLPAMLEYFSVPFDLHPRKAKEICFESRFLAAEEARELGFVNRVYSAERLLPETLAYAERVAENGRMVLRTTKLAIHKAWDLMGYSNAVEAAFADYLVMMQNTALRDAAGPRRLGGVELALRGLRGERAGLRDGPG